jgi:hypothetical protein
MTMSIEAAAQALREATRETVRRYSTWYLIQGVLMVIRNRRVAVPICVVGRPCSFSRLDFDHQRYCARYQSDRRAKRSEFLASIGVGCPVNNCRRALSSPPRGGRCHFGTPFDCLLYGGGFRKTCLFAYDPAASKLGLGLSKWHCWNTAVFVSFGKPQHDSGLAAWCVARDSAYLRRRGS